MYEKRYMISDAAGKLSVEPHVLRYWEEELELSIPRNEMGHRFYAEKEMYTLKMIKYLKEKGFQLRAIKMLLPDLHKIEKLSDEKLEQLREEMNTQAMLSEEKSACRGTTYLMAHRQGQVSPAREKDYETVVELSEDFDDGSRNGQSDNGQAHSETMKQFRQIMKSIVVEALQETSPALSDTVSSQVSERMVKEMDYQMRTKEENDEKRFKQLEAVITGGAISLPEAASSLENGPVKTEKKNATKKFFALPVRKNKQEKKTTKV